MDRITLKKTALNTGAYLAKAVGLRLGESYNGTDAEQITDNLFVCICCMMYAERSGFVKLSEPYSRQTVSDAMYEMYRLMPGIFEDVTEYLPEDISFLSEIRSVFYSPEYRDDVTVIGRLYQYYHSQRKERIFADLDREIKITKQTLPAATQFFTPVQITQYMVQNVLSGYCSDPVLLRKWQYRSDRAVCCADTPVKPEKIRCIDPCCGSGNILCALFDALMDIYASCGISGEDAAASIIVNNIYGLDIDPVVVTTARFSLLMKAAKYDKRIFTKGIKLNIYTLRDCRPGYDTGCGIEDDLENAGEYGSLLMPESEPVIRDDADPVLRETLNGVGLLAERYDAVITNPPYMGKKNLSGEMRRYLEHGYKKGKSELYAAFILRCKDLLKEGGCCAMVTIHSWMFLSSFAPLRELLLRETAILSVLHTGAGTFEDLNSYNVLSAVFCLRKSLPENAVGKYTDLTGYSTFAEKWEHLNDECVTFNVRQDSFSVLPGKPFVYSMSAAVLSSYRRGRPLREYAQPRQGMATGDNEKYVRFWYEVRKEDIAFSCSDEKQAVLSGCRWFPYNKGGNFRRWYGSPLYVVDWRNNGSALKVENRAVIRNEATYFREGITWSLFGFEGFSVRYKPPGYIYDVSGSSMFPEKNMRNYILGFLCSKVAFLHLSKLAPTVNFQVGNIGSLPLIIDESHMNEIDGLVEECIRTARQDSDEDELSPYFREHPLLKYGCTMGEAYKRWRSECESRIARMKSCEEKLNRIFIDIYGMNGEISPEVRERDITLHHPGQPADIKSMISYAVGCMIGRFASRYCCAERYIVWDENMVQKRICSFFENAFGSSGISEITPEGFDLALYLRREFYEDHIKRYHKRPVYIMFESGRRKTFRCLVQALSIDVPLLELIRSEVSLRIQMTGMTKADKTELVSFEQRLGETIRKWVDHDPGQGTEKLCGKLEGVIVKFAK